MIINRLIFSKLLLIIASLLLVTIANPTVASNIAKWQKINYSLSGLARMNPAYPGYAYSFVGVVDSKNSGEVRTIRVDIDSNNSVSTTVLNWKNGFPDDLSDLESVAAIPNNNQGTAQQFVTTNSSGDFWRFTVNSSQQIDNVVRGSKDLKQSGSTSSAKEIESVAFFINSSSQKIKLVWAGRGSRDHSAYIFAADLSNGSSSITYSDDHDFQIQETHFNWPRPVWSDDGDTRLISDLKVATNPNGKIFVSSAFDGGNDGPFGSVLYNPGTFIKASKINFNSAPYSPKTPLFIRDVGKKTEALELLTGNPQDGFILGTDDENLQGYVMILK